MSDAAAEALLIEISRPSAGVFLVVLSGEMDIVSSADFGRRMAELELGEPAHVVVDLAGLTFVDSSGINKLVHAVKAVEARGGTAVLAAPSPAASRVFEIARVAQIVRVEHDRADAFGRHPGSAEPEPLADDVR